MPPSFEIQDDSLGKSAPLKRAVRRGAGALLVVQIASQVVSLVAVALLMRLLAPDDFGLLGMVLPVVMLLRIVTTLGLNIATIQRHELSPAEVSSLFWLHVGLAVLTALGIVALAPWLGTFYRDAELAIPLRNVAWALAGIPLVTALGAQHQALLERNLHLPRLGIIRIVAQLTSALVAVIVAWAYRGGVWALVVQQYVELGLLTVLAWWAVRWWPGRFQLAPEFFTLIRFGLLFAASSFVLFIAENGDRVLVGRLEDAHTVGLYRQAHNLMMKPVYLVTTPLAALLVASLARATGAAATRAELAVAYYRLTGIALLPASVGLALVSGDVMHVFGGNQWDQAAPLLAVLSLAMFTQAVLILGGYVLAAAGQLRRLIAVACLLTGIMLASYLAGWAIGRTVDAPAVGIAAARAVAALLLLVPYTLVCVKPLQISLGAILRSWRRPLSATVVMGAFVWMFAQWLAPLHPAPRLALLTAVGTIVYAALAREELAWLARHRDELQAG